MNRMVQLRAEDGDLLPLEPARWHSEPTAGEARLLDGVIAPVLDVGCGPGRVVHLLARRGAVSMGIDPAPGAVRIARGRGCPVLQRSVFDRLPLEGCWATVLLLDGNIGIGGDPTRLMRRCRAVLRPGGRVMVEVAAPGTTSRTCKARLERGGETTEWFPWAVVGADGVGSLARSASLDIRRLFELEGDRWIAVLARP